jgi:hypothetical protein
MTARAARRVVKRFEKGGGGGSGASSAAIVPTWLPRAVRKRLETELTEREHDQLTGWRRWIGRRFVFAPNSTARPRFWTRGRAR